VNRTELIDQVRVDLARAGYAVSERCDLRPVSFDLVARRDDHLLIVKVLTNVDALSDPIAQEIKLLCKFLHARPILVGLRAGAGVLEDGVMYNRHDVPIVTPATLREHILRGESPMVFAAPGGFYVHLDSEALRAARVAAELSLGVMAQRAGVSRRAIQMYEHGMSASIEAAMRLEDFLGVELIRPLDPFASFRPESYEPERGREETGDPVERLVMGLLQGLGYDVRRTQRSPFNALSTQDADTLLTGIGEEGAKARRRAKVIHSVSRITERPGFFVVERTTRTEIHGLPVVSRHELMRLDDPQRILDLILERARGERT